MTNQTYKKQVELLLSVLPEVAKETCFALHGGTAINLFVRNMPRLSVDIDMTYLPIEERSETLLNIGNALERISENISRNFSRVKIKHDRKKGKLRIDTEVASIKVEINLVGRGTLTDPLVLPLCEKAQIEFDAFSEIQVVPFGQLYGGKICAALDRQHPRDLFDVKYLIEDEGFTDAVKKGFFLSLLSSDRPINELLTPNYLDQRETLKNQFSGMSTDLFTYDDFENTREKLVRIVQESLTTDDKMFLFNFTTTDPTWEQYDFSEFPAVRWKLQNLNILKEKNPKKFEKQLIVLEKVLKF